MEIAALILSSISVVLLAAFIVINLKREERSGNAEFNAEMISILREEIRRESASVKENVTTQLNIYSNTVNRDIEANERRFDEFQKNTDQRLEQIRAEIVKVLAEVSDGNAKQLDRVRQEVAKNIADLNESNVKQLDKMRETVDEKLTATLDQRFKQSFQIVSESLEVITKNFGEIKSLTSDVTDLRRVLTNVKTRGTWGEVSLDNLLSQILTPDQYQRSFNLDKREGGQMVDFVINLPGRDDDKVYLPIDAKFPLEDFQRLTDATTIVEQELARKALANRIKQEAVSIKNKYIRPPKTTDFAIMFLPTEGLFAEALQISGLADEVQNKHRVILCGPTTIAALLNSLQMGFKTLAIEKRSSEIWKLLGQFKRDFGTFSDLLGKTQKQLEQVSKTIEGANNRTDIIRRKLSRVETDNEDLIEDDGISLDFITGGERADEN